MGMFDEVILNKPCLKCGKTIRTLQTKSTLCTLRTYEKGDEMHFRGAEIKDGAIEVYGYCSACRYWHDGKAIVKDGKFVEITDLVLGDKVN